LRRDRLAALPATPGRRPQRLRARARFFRRRFGGVADDVCRCRAGLRMASPCEGGSASTVSPRRARRCARMRPTTQRARAA
jgi:hypothetical protein